MPTVGFREILVYGTPILTVLFTYLLAAGRDKPLPSHPGVPGILRKLNILMLAVFTAFTSYSVNLGYRPIPYFILAAGLFTVHILYILYCRGKPDPKITVTTILLVTTSELLTITLGNRFYPRYNWQNNSILQTGSLTEHQKKIGEAGLYYYIPVGALTSTILALTIEPSQLTLLVYALSRVIGLTLAFFTFLRRADRKPVTGALGVFLLMASPGDTFMMGRLITQPYIALYLLLALLFFENPLSSAIGLTLVSLPMIFAHGSGFVAAISILAPLAVMGVKGWPSLESDTWTWKTPALKLTIVTFTYWAFTYIIASITRIGIQLYDSLYSYLFGTLETTPSPTYIPVYFSEGNEVYAYAWVIPVALTAALTLYTLIALLRREKFNPDSKVYGAIGFTGCTLTATAYLSYLRGGAGQYLIPSAYFILLIASSATARKLLSKEWRHTVTILLLLSLFVAVGMYSPSHAPLEHPEFESAAYILRYPRYVEAQSVKPWIPEEAAIYYDYDFPVKGGLYKPIRRILHKILSGAPLEEYVKPPITMFAVKTDRIPNSNITLQKLDIVYLSRYHTIIAVP